MADDEVKELISSVAHRGASFAVTTAPEEIRNRFATRTSRRRGHLTITRAGRRVSVVLVAALILAVFVLPLPHMSLLRRIVSPATRPTTTLTSRGLRLGTIWAIGARTVWASWSQPGGLQGLSRSLDGGRTFSDSTPPGLNEQAGNHFITSFFALDAKHTWVSYGGVGSTDPQRLEATSDGGRHWKILGRKPGNFDCELQFVSPVRGWCTMIGAAAGSEAVQLYRTDDGGKHWRLISETTPSSSTPGALPFGCDKNIQFVSSEVGWAMFQCSGGLSPLYETINGGLTWVRQKVEAPAFSFDYGGFAGVPDLVGTNGAIGYTFYVSNSSVRKSVVYVSSDGGRSWRAVVPPGAPKGWVVDTLTPLKWRLVGGNKVLATNDGGRSWFTITDNANLNPLVDEILGTHGVEFASPMVGWVVSTAASGAESLWRTTDGGVDWSYVDVPAS